ncbi:MAG: hypothetical protein Q9165_000866 [Trypethelium subeluteriae]
MPRLAPFRIGRKQVPNFTLTLLRTPYLPPTFASFITPLNINKLDIRDYLFHVYGVTCIKVRSYVQQQRVRQSAPRQWYRPRAVKRMTVEMDKPFVWPEAPTDFEPWSKETFDAAHEEQDNLRKQMQPSADTLAPMDRETLAEQAERLLSGKEKWRPQWQADGGASRSAGLFANPESRPHF